MKANWAERKLSEVARIEGGGTPKRTHPEYFSGDIPWITPTDLDAIGNICRKIRARESITEVGLKNSSAKLVPAGSVLFSSRATIGKIAITDIPCATNQGFANFVPDQSVIDTEYLAHVLSGKRSEIIKLAGKTTFLEVPRGRLKEFKIPVPPLEEQRRIVARIKECMERVEEIERLRSEANAEREALAPALYEAIEKRSGWEEKSVGEVVTRTRNGKSIRQVNEESTGFVLSLAAVHSVTLNIEAKKPIILPEAFAKTYAIRTGDIFVSRSNTRDLVGLSSVANECPDKTIFPDLLIQLTARSNVIIPRYLAYSLRTRSARKQIKDRAVGTSQSMVKISAERLKEVKIPVPSLKEQRELVAALDEASENIRMMKSEADESKIPHLRDAILRKAFAGEL